MSEKHTNPTAIAVQLVERVQSLSLYADTNRKALMLDNAGLRDFVNSREALKEQVSELVDGLQEIRVLISKGSHPRGVSHCLTDVSKMDEIAKALLGKHHKGA